MTQALALADLLVNAGHEISHVMIGEDPERPIPSFFRREIRAPLVTYPTPMLRMGPGQRNMSLTRTLFSESFRVGQFFKAIPVFERSQQHYRPDLIINFLDPIGAAYLSKSRPGPKCIALAHNFRLFRPSFVLPPGKGLQFRLMNLYARFAGAGADLTLAMSLSPTTASVGDQTTELVVPPLLRSDVFSMVPEAGDALVFYTLNPGYFYRVERWHRENPSLPVRAFLDRSARAFPRGNGKLTVQNLDGKRFLRELASARALVCSAGFQAVAEAAYLGKPVLVFPTGNHIEQLCNAIDADHEGLAKWSTEPDLDMALKLSPPSSGRTREYRSWVGTGPEIYLRAIEEVGCRAR